MPTTEQQQVFEWGMTELARLEADNRVIDPDNLVWEEWQKDMQAFVVSNVMFCPSNIF
jgi:hypothetical protein